jgi:hypothetical protein
MKGHITKANYNDFGTDGGGIAYLNAKAAPFVDAVIYTDPMIGIQEKQRTGDKIQQMDGKTVSKVSQAAFDAERGKFLDDKIFIYITDSEEGDGLQFGPLDVMIDWKTYPAFAGPLNALRKVFSSNQLNPPAIKSKAVTGSPAPMPKEVEQLNAPPAPASEDDERTAP